MFARAYSGGVYDYPFAAALGEDGAVYLVDAHIGEGFDYDVIILKVDFAGEPIWVKGYKGEGREEAYGACWAGDGLVVVGKTDTSALIFKVDGAGELMWAKKFRGLLKTVVELPNGDLVAAGTCEDTSGSLGTSVLLLTPSGSLRRAVWIGSEKSTQPWAVAPARGGFLVLVELGIAEVESSDHLLLKFDTSGALLWAKVYDTGFPERGLGVTQGENGDLLIAEEIMDGASTTAALIALDSSGNFRWAEEMGPGPGWLYAALPTEDGYLVGGGYHGEDASSIDFFLVKVDFDGVLIWARRLENPGSVYRSDDKAFFLADAGDYYLVAGEGAYTHSLALFTLTKSGEYPDCVDTPSVSPVSIEVSAREASLKVETLPWSLGDVQVTTYPISVDYVDICAPGEISQGAQPPRGSACVPVPGGLLVKVSSPRVLKVYSPTGRLILRRKVSGRQVFKFRAGVYLWDTGDSRGTAVVR